MKFNTKLMKIGGSYFLMVPKSIIDVYELLDEEYLWELSDYKNGKILSYKRVNKEIQTEKKDDKEKQ